MGKSIVGVVRVVGGEYKILGVLPLDMEKESDSARKFLDYLGQIPGMNEISMAEIAASTKKRLRCERFLEFSRGKSREDLIKTPFPVEGAGIVGIFSCNGAFMGLDLSPALVEVRVSDGSVYAYVFFAYGDDIPIGYIQMETRPLWGEKAA